MEHADAFMIIIYILQVIEALQNKMGGVVEQAGPGMMVGMFEEHFIGYAIVQVFSGMDLIA
jgi:hypothetical protein